MHTVCPICDIIRDNPGVSNPALGRLANTTESSIRRHKAHEPLPIEAVDPFFSVPNEYVTSRGSSIRTPDGSWQKITWQPGKALWDKVLTYDDIERALNDYKPVPTPQPNGETLVVVVADAQAGKVAAGGGTQEMINRAMSCLGQITAYCAERSFSEIVLVDAGDVIENFSNTIQQAQTNDLSLTDQVRAAQRLILEHLKRLAPLTEKLTYVAVSSNHGANRSGIGDKARANFPSDDFGLLIQDNIAQWVEGRPEFAHVSFVKPTRFEESCTYQTQDGTVIGFTHGHLTNKQEQLPQWYANQIAGRRSGLDTSDMLLVGHFHSAYFAEAADGRPVIGAPTLDGGSDWYSNKTGVSSKPGMLTFKVDSGEMNGWRIWRP